MLEDAADLLARASSLEIVRARSIRDERRTYEVIRGAQRLALKLYRSVDPTPPHPVSAQISFVRELPPTSGRLVIPRIVEHGHDARFGHWILFEWLDGECHDALWHVSRPPHDGGRGVRLAWADRCIDLISDLPRIGSDQAAFSSRAMESLEIVSPGRFVRSVAVHAGRAVAKGLLSTDEAIEVERHARSMEDRASGRPLIVSNADFRFANMISLPDGRTGLVDWDGVRASAWEASHCVAYLWIRMWNHPSWQDRLVQRAREKLHLGRDELRALLVERTLVQMHTDRDRPGVPQIQRRLLSSVLDDEQFEGIWSGDSSRRPIT